MPLTGREAGVLFGIMDLATTVGPADQVAGLLGRALEPTVEGAVAHAARAATLRASRRTKARAIAAGAAGE